MFVGVCVCVGDCVIDLVTVGVTVCDDVLVFVGDCVLVFVCVGVLVFVGVCVRVGVCVLVCLCGCSCSRRCLGSCF